MSARSLGEGVLLSLLSVAFTFACAEGAVRMLQRLGRLPRYSMASFATPNAQLNARLVRSENPRLHLEFARDDPNVNEAGFRGRSRPLEKRPGSFRIAVLGDSVTYGYSVPLRDVFTTRLEERLQRAGEGRRFEVLNFGVNGYGTAAELELYDSKVQSYHPDLVLLAYVLNDPIPPHFLTEMDGAARRRTRRFQRVSAVSQFGAWLFLAWQELGEGRRAQGNYEAFYGSPEAWRIVQDSVRELSERSRRDGFALAAVVFPLLLDYRAYPMEEQHRRIAAELERNGIPYLDLLDAYRRAGAETLRIHPRDDTHPNAHGHRIAARELHRFLARIGVLEPRRPSRPVVRAPDAGARSKRPRESAILLARVPIV